MGRYNFDKIVDRKHTKSLKYDFAVQRGKPADVLPFWVADMDFEIPSELKQVLLDRVNHGIFGYTESDVEYFNILKEWFANRFNWNIDKKWLVKTPGVVFALAMAVRAFTKEGEGVLINQPVYYPFSMVIDDNDRRLINVPLVKGDEKYTIDFEGIERAIIEENVTLFLLCNPHNPVGHVWTLEEMDRLFSICQQHKVLIISDEIHQDLITGLTPFTSALTVSNGAYTDKLIAMSSLSKSFNIASLHHAEVIIPNEELRNHYNAFKALVYHTDSDVLAEAASTAAYTHPEAEAWLMDLLNVVKENYDYMCNKLHATLPELRISPMDGTYLAWIDFSAYLKPEEMHDFFENKCGIAPSFGEWFGGESYATFVRLNLATSLENIKIATTAILQNI